METAFDPYGIPHLELLSAEFTQDIPSDDLMPLCFLFRALFRVVCVRVCSQTEQADTAAVFRFLQLYIATNLTD